MTAAKTSISKRRAVPKSSGSSDELTALVPSQPLVPVLLNKYDMELPLSDSDDMEWGKK